MALPIKILIFKDCQSIPFWYVNGFYFMLKFPIENTDEDITQYPLNYRKLLKLNLNIHILSKLQCINFE